MTQANELFKETLVIVKQAWADGKYTPKDYMYLLMLAHIDSVDGFTIKNVEAFCEEWNLTESQFEEGTAALVRDGLVEETMVSSSE